MSARIKSMLAQGERDHDLEPPAPKEEIEALIASTQFELPTEYIEFLATHNGGSGELPVQPWCYELWPANEVSENNEGYEVAKYFPDCFAIGSNQGGELLYIDYRQSRKGNIISIPLIPSDLNYANVVALSFNDLISLLGVTCKFG